jgi:hypothetical protein
MTGRYLLKWILLLSGMVSITANAGDLPAAKAPDIALLEFLGELADDADEWDEFFEVAATGMPPVLAEADHAD